jgi:hypothetical protein
METIDQLVSIVNNLQVLMTSLGALMLSVSGGAAWLSAVLPVPEREGIYSILHKYINILGGNVGKAKNAAGVVGE